MKIFAALPSKYLKAADLHDKHISVTMSHVMLEQIVNKDGPQLLPVLYFQGVSKGMVINKTRAKVISAVYTDETDAWAGMPIVLFPDMVDAYGSMVETIRVKASGYSSGGPSAAERIRAINESPHKEVLSEHMLERTLDRPMTGAAWVPPDTSEANMARAKEAFPIKPTPRPKRIPLAEAMAIHGADGVVWDETAERLPTEEEKAELLRESMIRANAAMDERKANRGAAQPGDGLDIPTFLQRNALKPQEPDYGPHSWIEHMQAAE